MSSLKNPDRNRGRHVEPIVDMKDSSSLPFSPKKRLWCGALRRFHIKQVKNRMLKDLREKAKA